MTDNIFIFGIPLPLKQASNSRLKFFPRELLPFRVFMTLFLTAVMLFPLSLQAETRDNSLQIPIGSYIVKETGRSNVLMEKDIERTVSPASLTKILTCIMAIESGRLEDNVLITKESTLVEPSKAGFHVGDKIRLVDLVKAAMINSSNDAAFAIAIYLSGNVDSFVAAMNYKARRIGMKNSRFTNPAGFDNGLYAGNISTAEDLLYLTEYAIRNPVFNQIARLDQAVFTEQTSQKVYCLKTHNKLLNKYPYAVGIKTGFTSKAGRCLIARAVKDNKDILLVMLNAKTDRWNVAVDIFDKAFSTNNPNQDSFAQLFRGDSGVTRAPLIASLNRVDRREQSLSKSEHKLSKRVRKHHAVAELRTSRTSKKEVIAKSRNSRILKRESIAGLRSRSSAKHHAVAELRTSRTSKRESIAKLRTSRTSKREAIAELRTSRTSKREAIAKLRNSRMSKSDVIAGRQNNKKSKTQQLAKLKNGHRQKNSEVVLSKPVRKNKKRVASLYTPVIMNIRVCQDVSA
jgi:serine-type D-Ala-D-Ala carboxypeptidase (penicillin-binding protein 5/6)